VVFALNEHSTHLNRMKRCVFSVLNGCNGFSVSYRLVPEFELGGIEAREQEKRVTCGWCEGPIGGVQAPAHDDVAGVNAAGQHGDGGELVLEFVGVLEDEEARLEVQAGRRDDIAQAHGHGPSAA
jgi:hypothetical protein